MTIFMGSVHQDARGRSKFWYGAYTTAAGQRRMVSTKIEIGKTKKEKSESREAALAVVRAWEKAEGLACAGTITKARIEEILNHTLRSIGLQEIETTSVRQWFKDWLAGKRSIAESSRGGYEHASKEFLEFMGRRAALPIDAVTENDINKFVDHLRSDGRSVSTVNKIVRKYVSGAFEKARKLGKIKYNPVMATDPLKDDAVAKDTFSAEQVARLVAAAKGTDWEGLILFAYGSGARQQDCANLRWSSVDVINGVVVFKERKTGRQAVVGLHPDFVDWLTRQPQTPTDPEGFVFPSLAGRTGTGSNGLCAQFDELMERAKVEGRILREGSERNKEGKRTGKGRQVRSLTLHSFRHTAASAVFNSEAVREVARRVSNHARGGALERYLHQDLEPIRQATKLIPRLPKA
jgi:integrase